MLKIKDDVDLKELKKFGFLNKEDCYYRNINNAFLFVMTNNRIIGIQTDCGIHTFILDVLFDLIQEGIVKEVDK